MLIGGVATWLGSSRPRCVFLLLCSPLLLPLLLAIFPILCVGALCFNYSCRRWKKSPEELLDEDGLRQCEEGCYRGCGGEEEAKKQDEECLLHRYLEDQLLLIRFAYECEDGNGNVNGDFQFPDIDDTTIPLLANSYPTQNRTELQKNRKKTEKQFSCTATKARIGRRRSRAVRRKTGFDFVGMAKHDEIVPPQYDVNAKWDACLDLLFRRFVYSSAAGAFTGLLLFRRPVTRWASIAFGAGYGIGSAYTDCSRIFDGSSTKSQLPKSSEPMIPQDGQD